MQRARAEHAKIRSDLKLLNEKQNVLKIARDKFTAFLEDVDELKAFLQQLGNGMRQVRASIRPFACCALLECTKSSCGLVFRTC